MQAKRAAVLGMSLAVAGIASCAGVDPGQMLKDGARGARDLIPGQGNAQTASEDSYQPIGSGKGQVVQAAEGAMRASCRDFPQIAAEKQETSVWCWAACVEMVSKYGGRDVSQADIAARIHGKATDANGNLIPEKAKRAGVMEIMVALNPDLQPQYQRQLTNQALAGQTDVSFDATSFAKGMLLQNTYDHNAAIRDLSRGMPVVCGLNDPGGRTGHAYVIHAATFKPAASALASHTLQSIEAVDPMTGQSVSISADDFKARVGFMISQERARQTLQGYLNSVKLK